jgi:hypothetical protein
LKILRDRVLENQKTLGAAARWRGRQRQLGSGSGSLVAARHQGTHDNNIRIGYLQNLKPVGAAAQQHWQRQLGSGSNSLVAERHQEPHDDNINQNTQG